MVEKSNEYFTWYSDYSDWSGIYEIVIDYWSGLGVGS
jgi:hypothetical protein